MRIVRIALFVMASIMIIVGVSMMINGSLQMSPTSEQQDKAHIAGAVLAFVGIIISILIWICRKK